MILKNRLQSGAAEPLSPPCLLGFLGRHRSMSSSVDVQGSVTKTRFDNSYLSTRGRGGQTWMPRFDYRTTEKAPYRSTVESGTNSYFVFSYEPRISLNTKHTMS